MEQRERSIYQELRQVEFALGSLWGNVELQDLDTPARKALEATRRQVQAAQAVAKDYEFSESEEDTRAQLRLLPKAVKSLEQLRGYILKASEYDLLGAVDVAQLSAQLDTLIDRLR
jgi:hypothetical protein